MTCLSQCKLQFVIQLSGMVIFNINRLQLHAMELRYTMNEIMHTDAAWKWQALGGITFPRRQLALHAGIAGDLLPNTNAF